MSDNRELAVWDVFSSSVSNLHVFEGEEELSTRFFECLQLSEAYGSDLLKRTTLYAREKQLIYGCGLVTGKLARPAWKRPKAIAAPLVLFEASISNADGRYELRIDYESCQPNTPLLEAIAHNHLRDIDILDIPSSPLKASHLLGLIDQALPENKREYGLRLINFPKLDSKSLLENHYKKSGLKAHPAATVFLAQRSTQTRGIIHELELLSDKTKEGTSQPLQRLLGKSETLPPTRSTSCNPDRVPSILSLPQRKILKAAASQPLSQVIGPPGTGKSFTIASIAIERFIAGESVLIVAKNDQAIEVLTHKLESELNISGVVMRGGDSSYMQKMKESIEGWLHGYGLDSASQTPSQELEQELEGIGNRLDHARRNYEARSRRLVKWGAHYARIDEGKGSLLFRLTNPIRKREILKEETHLANLLTDVEKLEEVREKVVARLVEAVWQERLRQAIQENREQLSTFLKSLRSRSSGKQGELHQNLDFKSLLGVFPIWLTTLQSLHKILPLKRNLFNLLLIDEATQCDMACALPALQRAQRACLVGDPKQLRHVSFLSHAKQENLAKENDLSLDDLEALNFRKNSLLDLVDNSQLPYEAVNLLDEHFRSRPELIAFSNRKFYHGSLKIMKELSSNPHKNLPLKLEYISGARRETSGINAGEAESLIEHLQHLVNSEKGLEQSRKTSIGILSPFTAQVNYLAKEIEKKFEVATLLEHRILVGSPYSFQGEERDCMLISLALDSNSHPQTLRHVERPDVFNVSITRAKNQQIVFHSLSSKDLKSESLIREYLDDAIQESVKSTQNFEYTKDYFLNEITAALQKHSHTCEPDKQIAGLQVDLLCRSSQNNKTIALNLIGYPGAFEAAHRLESFLVFKRAGLEMLPVSYPLWRIAPKVALRHILERLEDTTFDS